MTPMIPSFKSIEILKRSNFNSPTPIFSFSDQAKQTENSCFNDDFDILLFSIPAL